MALIADFNGGGDGVLTLDGEIRGYGVEGGGTSTLSTSGVVVIGDASYEIGSTLPAGSVTPADVTLTEALFIRAGEPLPAAYSQTITTVAAGAALPTDVPIPTTIVAAEWVVPAGAVSIAYVRPGTSAVVAAPPGTVIPVGSTVRGYSTQTPICPATSAARQRLSLGPEADHAAGHDLYAWNARAGGCDHRGRHDNPRWDASAGGNPDQAAGNASYRQ